MFKRLADFIGVKLNWEYGDFYMRSIDEMKEQLDIGLLIKKISIL